MSTNIPFYNFQVPEDEIYYHPNMVFLPQKGIERLLESAMKQRGWHRENNHPKAEVNLNFGPLAFTTEGCETTQNLIEKYQAARKEQELEKRKFREKFLKSWPPHLRETADAFDKLNGEEMDEAVQKTSFANILPLIEWFEKATVMSDVAYHLFKNVCDTLDLKINAARLEAKLVEKGFPTYEQWNEQTRCPYGGKEPVMEEKYAVLSRIERYGIGIASDIQFVSRPRTYMSHFWDFIENYKEALNAGQSAPRVIQKSHANNLHRKPDTSRGDRTGGTSAIW